MSTQPHHKTILVVDDHVEMARVLADQLGDAGYQVATTGGGSEAIALLRSRPFDLVVTDLRMREVDGFDVLAAAHEGEDQIPVIIMTAFGAIESAVEAIRRGAYHYLTKPLKLDELLIYVERALGERRLRTENRALHALATERSRFGALIGRSAAMRDLYQLLERIARASAPVLIRAESGTGKELVARALHFEGPRRERAFVAVNCAALPEALLESELFGHVRGAFSGATAARRGLFLEADGGTLFLDEIGDMPLPLQAKLLRVLEEGEVRAVGSDQTRRVDVRIVAATHRDLDARVREGTFRADLYYRLNVVPVTLPPLRERVDDIPLLVEHFLERARRRNPSSPVQSVSPDCLAALGRYPWPGNVRELENLIERLVIVALHEELGAADLARHAPALLEETPPLAVAQQTLVPLRQLEREYITWVVARCQGNKTRAAEILGIDVSTIHRRERGER